MISNLLKRTNRQYKFDEVTNLCLFDLKARKKTMNMKKFRNIPLSEQETMQQKFKKQEQKAKQNRNLLYQTISFRIRSNAKTRKKLIERLSKTKTTQYLCNREEIKPLQNIISKCQKLKQKILTQARLQKVQKITNRQYNNLIQQSKLCLAMHGKRH